MKYIFSLSILVALTVTATAQTWRINTVAGNGIQGFSGDGFTATNAALSGPLGVDMDSIGNYYILDYYNRRIRKVNTANVISTVAGIGVPGNTGDNSQATNASMSPRGLVVTKKGDMYIADESYAVIRKVNAITGVITRYAGNATYGYSGDGGAALGAQMKRPFGMALDAGGNLYVADVSSHTVRKITTSGIISTVAGDDTAGYSGDGGQAHLARLDSPYAVAVDRKGNVYISDHQNNVIRKVDTFNVITTVAGIYNTYGRTGDGGPAVLATLNGPKGIHVDSLGNLYICDGDNHVIRKVDTFGNISTIVGTGAEGFGGDLGLALGANLDNPYDIVVDRQGSLYIADANNQRIRKVYNAALAVPGIASGNVTVYPNPAGDEVTVSGLSMSDKVCVYDLTGRKMFDWTIDTDDARPFIIRSMIPGTYILQVLNNTGDLKFHMKLVKK